MVSHLTKYFPMVPNACQWNGKETLLRAVHTQKSQRFKFTPASVSHYKFRTKFFSRPGIIAIFQFRWDHLIFIHFTAVIFNYLK